MSDPASLSPVQKSSRAGASLEELQDSLIAEWHQFWDVVETPEASVAIIMPWRATALVKPNRQTPTDLLPVEHIVTWIGFDPDRGVVFAKSRWDPRTGDKPTVGDAEWQDCDLDRFLLHVNGTAASRFSYMWSEDDLAHALDRRHERNNAFQYQRLPLAMQPGWGDIDPSQVMRLLEEKAFSRFIQALPIPSRVFNLAVNLGKNADGGHNPAMHAKGATAVAPLLWCAGNSTDEKAPAAERRMRRIQAVLAMPCFSKHLTQPKATAALTEPGVEMVQHLAEDMRIQPSTVRILANVSATMIGPDLITMRDRMQDTATLLLFDSMPRSTLRDLITELTPVGWQALHELAWNFYATLPEQALISIGAGLRRDADGSWDWLNTSGPAWRHMKDLAIEMRRDLIWPAEAAADPLMLNRVQLEDWGENLAITSLAALGPNKLLGILNQHLEGTLRRAQEVSAEGEADAARWPVPAEPIVAPSGQVIRFLSSEWELSHEGTMLRHCVGDYGDACRSGRSAIMSIGAWQGEVWHPTSTAEIRRSEDLDEIEVGQHFGRGNSNPPMADVDLLADWMAGLETGETLFDASLVVASSELEQIDQVLGSAWQTPAAVDARWDRWRRILDVRHHSAAEFLQSAMEKVGIGNPPTPRREGGTGTVWEPPILKVIDKVVAFDAEIARIKALAQATPDPATMPAVP